MESPASRNARPSQVDNFATRSPSSRLDDAAVVGPRARAVLPVGLHIVVERDPTIEKAVAEIMEYARKALKIPGVRQLLSRGTRVIDAILARHGIEVSDPKLAAILAEVYRRIRTEMADDPKKK